MQDNFLKIKSIVSRYKFYLYINIIYAMVLLYFPLRKRNKKIDNLVIALTSYSKRLDNQCVYAISSLLWQTLAPVKVILYVAHGENVPRKIRLLMYKGLEIIYTNDLKSYKKLIPALKLYSDCIIVTADDDVFYTKKWLEDLYRTSNLYPECIVAHRAHNIKILNGKIEKYSFWNKSVNELSPSFTIFPTGVGGILYPPESLFNKASNSQALEICPNADDIWFWGMAVLKGTKFITVNKSSSFYVTIDKSDQGLWGRVNSIENSLSLTNNDRAIANITKEFPEILKKIIAN